MHHSNLRPYAEVIKDCWRLRQVITVAQDAIARANAADHEDTADAIAGDIAGELLALADAGTELSESTAQRALKGLAKAGRIVVERHDGKRSSYNLQINPSEATPVMVTGVSHCDPLQADGAPPSPRHPTPLTKTPEPEPNRKEAVSAEAVAENIEANQPEDPKAVLFRTGLEKLSAMHEQPAVKVRPLIGKLLSAAGQDAAKVVTAIERATQQRPADPFPWLLAAVKARRAPQSMNPPMPTEFPAEVNGFVTAAVVEHVLDILDVGEQRFRDLPGAVVNLLREGHDTDAIYGAANSIARGGVDRMHSAGLLVTAVRTRTPAAAKKPSWSATMSGAASVSGT